MHRIDRSIGQFREPDNSICQFVSEQRVPFSSICNVALFSQFKIDKNAIWWPFVLRSFYYSHLHQIADSIWMYERTQWKENQYCERCLLIKWAAININELAELANAL